MTVAGGGRNTPSTRASVGNGAGDGKVQRGASAKPPGQHEVKASGGRHMFTATGLGVRKNDDSTATVRVLFTDNRVTPAKQLFEQSFTGAAAKDIKAQIDTVLAKLKASEDDAGLQAQYVGQIISSI